MNKASVAGQIEQRVREKLAGESTGHDWWHTERVRATALRLGRQEKADLRVVELAALLHDVADWKFHDGDTSVGPQLARQWLEELRAPEATIRHVCSIIEGVSFKGAGVETPMATLEGRVVQDADRLDALGAIGIARAFAYGGSRGRPLHEPGKAPERHESFEQYSKSQGSTVNHFYEKLLLLKDRMQTPAARQMAEARHAFMQEFLERFLREWEGSD